MKAFLVLCAFFAVGVVADGDEKLDELDGEWWITKFNLVQDNPGKPYHSQPITVFGDLTDDLPYAEGKSRYYGAWAYTLFQGYDKSNFHKLPGYTVLNHVRGGPLNIYMLDPVSKNLTETRIGPREDAGFVVVVPADVYVAMDLKRRSREGSYALLSVVSTPEVRGGDVVKGIRSDLRRRFPQHKDIIRRFTPQPVPLE